MPYARYIFIEYKEYYNTKKKNTNMLFYSSP
jgi:hypothetical protein